MAVDLLRRDGGISPITPAQALRPAERLSPVDELTETANKLLSEAWVQPELFRGPCGLSWLTQGEATVNEAAERFRAAGWKVTVRATVDQAGRRFHRLTFELPETAPRHVGQP